MPGKKAQNSTTGLDLFDIDAWSASFQENGIDITAYTTRGYGEDEILPWDTVDIGIKKEVFLAGYKKALGIIGDRK